MKRRTSADPIWGTDGAVSMPKPYDPDTAKVSMGGFVFTPQGIRVDVTDAEHQEVLASAYSPEAAGGA